MMVRLSGKVGRSFISYGEVVSGETHVEDVDIRSDCVVVSQALQSNQGLGKELVCCVQSAEIK